MLRKYYALHIMQISNWDVGFLNNHKKIKLFNALQDLVVIWNTFILYCIFVIKFSQVYPILVLLQVIYQSSIAAHHTEDDDWTKYHHHQKNSNHSKCNDVEGNVCRLHISQWHWQRHTQKFTNTHLMKHTHNNSAHTHTHKAWCNAVKWLG